MRKIERAEEERRRSSNKDTKTKKSPRPALRAQGVQALHGRPPQRQAAGSDLAAHEEEHSEFDEDTLVLIKELFVLSWFY